MTTDSKNNAAKLTLEQLKNIFEMLPGQMLGILDKNLEIVHLNRNFKDFLEAYFPTVESRMNPVGDFILKSGRDPETVFLHALRGHQEKDHLVVDSRHDANPEIRIIPLHAHGTETFAAAVISNRGNIESSQGKPAESYANLLSNLPETLLVLDAAGTIRDFSQASLKTFGIEKAANLKKRNILDFVTPRDREELDDLLRNIETRANIRRELTFLNYEGERFLAESNIGLLGQDKSMINILVMTIRNVGRYQDRMEKLKYRLEEFKKMLSLQPSYVWSRKIYQNGQELHTYVSKVIERVTGYPREFFHENPREILNIVHSEDQTRVAEHFEVLANAYDDEMQIEFRIIHADRSIRWLRSHVIIEYMDKGFRQLISTTTDITEQKEAKIALEKSEEKYRLISENTRDVIWTADLRGNITYVSPSIQEIMGYSQKEISHRPLSRFFTTSTQTKLKRLFNSLLSSEEEGDEDLIFQAEYDKKDGTRGWCEIKMSRMKKQDKTVGVQGRLTDISNRKEIEKVLIDEQKYAVENLMNRKSIFLSCDPGGRIRESYGKDLPGIKLKGLTGKRIQEVIPELEQGKKGTLFENTTRAGEIFNHGDEELRIFVIPTTDGYSLLLLDQKQLVEHRKQMIENLSMIQLILWS